MKHKGKGNGKDCGFFRRFHPFLGKIREKAAKCLNFKHLKRPATLQDNERPPLFHSHTNLLVSRFQFRNLRPQFP